MGRRRRRRGAKPLPRIGGKLDLHGSTTDEARTELGAFLEEAVSLGETMVLIVHGKGSGRLAGAVKALLDRSSHVARHRPAPQQMGGEGARLVELEPEPYSSKQ